MKKLSFIKEFRRLFGFLKHRSLRYWAGLLGLAGTSALSGIILAFVTKDMLDAAQYGKLDILLRGSILVLLGVLLLTLLQPFFTILMNGALDYAKSNTYRWLYQKLLGLPMSFYEKHHSGDIYSRVSFDVDDATAAFSGYFLDAVVTLFSGFANGVALFLLDVRFGLIVVAMGVVALLINRKFAFPFRQLNKRRNETRRDRAVKLGDILSGMPVIRLFGLQKPTAKEFHEASQQAAQANIDRAKAHSVLETANAIMNAMTLVLVMGVGVFLVAKGQATFGVILAVMQLMGAVHEMFTQLGGFVALTQRSLASAQRLFEITDQAGEPEVNRAEQPMPALDAAGQAVVLAHASFHYREGEPAVDDISLAVPRNTVFALVGPSGGGKSTLIKLILGFYPLYRGGITVLGMPMNEERLSNIREKMAYVPQEPYLFRGSIYENIAFGDLHAGHDEVVKAAKLANAYSFIMAQPQGFDTQVGERGSHLSGGQRQRIAIARAFLKNAPILLLDEATASLDSENEKAVQEAVERLMEDKTTLVVAHRISTIVNADAIAVIADGRIVEQGRHDELMGQNGVYAQLFNQQFAKPENVAGAPAAQQS